MENRKLGKMKINPKKYAVKYPNQVLQTLGLVSKFHTGLERVCLYSITHLKILDAYVNESADGNVRASSLSIAWGICPLNLSCYVSVRTFHITLSDEAQDGGSDVQ